MAKTGLLLSLCVLSTLFASTLTALDQAYCDNNMAKPTNLQACAPSPTFPLQFQMVIEQTMMTKKTANNMELQYSVPLNRMHTLVRELGLNSSEDWIDTLMDWDVKQDIINGAPQPCKYRSIDDSPYIKFFDLERGRRGAYILPPSEVILKWKTSSQAPEPVFVGKGTTRAGIPADKFQSCQFIPINNATVVVTYYVADKSILVSDYNTPPLLAADVVGSRPETIVEPKGTFHYRYDYVNIQPIALEAIDTIQVPLTAWCDAEDTKKSLPIMPYEFSYRMEFADLGDPGREFPTANLGYARQIYSDTDNVHQLDTIRGHIGKYPHLIRWIDDFSLGMSFMLDVNLGTCVVSSLYTGIHSTFKINNGGVMINDPQNFWDLKRTYKYLGVRHDPIRSIECDIWESFGGNSTRTWYFATAKWQRSMGYSNPIYLPIATEYRDAKYHLIKNIYEYAPETPAQSPDTSLCFSSKDSVRIQIVLSGGRYDTVYLNVADDFRRFFFDRVMTLGNFKTITRLQQLDVKPGGSNEIVAQFLIVGTPAHDTFKHTVKARVDYPSPKTIYDRIKSSFGSFSFKIYSKGRILTANLKGKSISVVNGPFSSSSTSSSSGYSAGSMAGIGLGLLFLGLILGIIGLFVYKKVTEGGGRSNDTGMAKLDEVR